MLGRDAARQCFAKRAAEDDAFLNRRQHLSRIGTSAENPRHQPQLFRGILPDQLITETTRSRLKGAVRAVTVAFHFLSPIPFLSFLGYLLLISKDGVKYRPKRILGP
jgi:hypothetical protein